MESGSRFILLPDFKLHPVRSGPVTQSRKTDAICICAICISLAIIGVLCFLSLKFGGEAPEPVTPQSFISTDYVNRIFDDTYVHQIDLKMPKANWTYLTDHATEEQYVICDAVIDGETFTDIAIRPKGNSSLSAIKAQDSDRFSFKIEFDHYKMDSTYYGLDKLSLNNLGQDVSCLKDFLTYHMMNEIGVAAPLSSYVQVKLNGEDFGLYLAVEAIEDSFAYRNYGADYGNIYKPECFEISSVTPKAFMNMDENPFGTDFESLGPGDRADILGTFIRKPFEAAFGSNMEVAALKYVGDDLDSYSVMFDSAVFDINKEDRLSFVNAVKTLNSGADASESLDVDSVIKYLIVHNFVNNYDSYSGVFVHNYYIREQDGRFSMIPWDYNLAFGIFTFQSAVKSFLGDDSPYNVELKIGNAMSDGKGMVNYPIDTPAITVDTSDRPLMNVIFSDEKYMALYHEYFTRFLNDFFASGKFQELFSHTWSIITPYIKDGQTFYTYYGKAEKGAKAVHDYCVLREESIRGQLDGTIPSTMKGQSEEWENLVEVGDLCLADSVTFDSLVFGISSQDIVEILDAISGENTHDSAGFEKSIAAATEDSSEVLKIVGRVVSSSGLVKKAIFSALDGPLVLAACLILMIVVVKRLRKDKWR